MGPIAHSDQIQKGKFSSNSIFTRTKPTAVSRDGRGHYAPYYQFWSWYQQLARTTLLFLFSPWCILCDPIESVAHILSDRPLRVLTILSHVEEKSSSKQSHLLANKGEVWTWFQQRRKPNKGEIWRLNLVSTSDAASHTSPHTSPDTLPEPPPCRKRLRFRTPPVPPAHLPCRYLIPNVPTLSHPEARQAGPFPDERPVALSPDSIAALGHNAMAHLPLDDGVRHRSRNRL